MPWGTMGRSIAPSLAGVSVVRQSRSNLSRCREGTQGLSALFCWPRADFRDYVSGGPPRGPFLDLRGLSSPIGLSAMWALATGIAWRLSPAFPPAAVVPTRGSGHDGNTLTLTVSIRIPGACGKQGQACGCEQRGGAPHGTELPRD